MSPADYVRWMGWFFIALLVLFAVLANPWFLRWLFDKLDERAERRDWRARFLAKEGSGTQSRAGVRGPRPPPLLR